MKARERIWVVVWAVLVSASAGAQECQQEIKCATIAPAGSAWDLHFSSMISELKTRTNGRLCIKNYAGGVQGDEKAVVQKMRSGQLQCAGLTGFGLGQIAPPVRVLELPFLFENGKEIDYVTSKMAPQLSASFAAGNPPTVNLGWAEAGFVYIISKDKPIKSFADLKGMKMWMWEGDPMAEALYKRLNVTPIQLSIADVLTSLQTGMIGVAYCPPLGCLALQWVQKTKYMTDLAVVNSTGAMVILKSVFDKLSPDLQTALKETAAKYTRNIVVGTRDDNVKAIETIKKLGIQLLPVDPTAKAELVNLGKQVWTDMAGKMYTTDQLNMVQTLVGEVRSGKSASLNSN